MIYFDEMGLSEISPSFKSNALLEYDENKEKVAFVEISNWIFEPSKMNRDSL